MSSVRPTWRHLEEDRGAVLRADVQQASEVLQNRIGDGARFALRDYLEVMLQLEEPVT